MTAAVFTLVAIVLLGVHWLRQGGWQGRLIEVERMPPKSARFEVDVNSASWTELAQVPEVGETLAQRIVEHRKAHGPFKSLDDLTAVPGIGPRTLELMRPALKEIPATSAAANQGSKPAAKQ